MENKINLSEVLKNNKRLDLQNILVYLQQKEKNTIVNDLCPTPHMEYDIEDLDIVWDILIHKFTT